MKYEVPIVLQLYSYLKHEKHSHPTIINSKGDEDKDDADYHNLKLLS